MSLWPPHQRPPACAGCWRNEPGRSYGFVPGVGRWEAPLIMLGEQPGQEEVRAGEGFVGRSGQEAEYAGVQRYNTFITNVRKCLGLTQETPEQRQATIAHCTEAYLALEFERLTFARSLLCVGADALQQATGLTEMVKYHGSQWTKQEVLALRVCSP